jgi:hypothetical protein
MPKPPLVSVVEDNQHFRGSRGGRLMRSLGYSVEVFPSTADSSHPLVWSKRCA